MRIYLAGPMTGYKDFNFPAFHKCAKELREMGHEVFNPAEQDIKLYGEKVFKGDGNHGALGVPSLRECLKMDLIWILDHGEGIALMRGWEKSRGATAEKATADALGLYQMVQDIDYQWLHKGNWTGAPL